MTHHGPRKQVDAGHASARLLQAREFHESARSLVTLGQSQSYNSAVTLMVTAVVAYADAITAKARGVVNKQDHQNAPRLLREALGNRLTEWNEVRDYSRDTSLSPPYTLNQNYQQPTSFQAPRYARVTARWGF